MWLEGKTTPVDFPKIFNQLMTTIPQGASEPLWEMVSSNVGSSVDDDGYVFYSKGSTGRDNIYIGLKNAFEFGEVDWDKGQRFSIFENYKPSTTPNQNGVFTGSTQIEYIRYHHNSNFASATAQTLEISYKVSITKDRVIIILINSGIASSQSAERVRNMIYLGLMNRYSEEADSTASIIGTTHGIYNNSFNKVRSLTGRNHIADSESDYVYKVKNAEHFIVNVNHSGFGGRFHAVNIPMYKDNEGIRGELDGVLCQRYIAPQSGNRNLNEESVVLIDGKQYYLIYKRYYSSGGHDNFCPASHDMFYFIEMK